jgi:putative PIN family toxin of toxin-antitoxin system
VSSVAVIVDTNVVVAGLLTANPASAVARLLDAMLRAALPYAVSEALLAEYHAVLVRPRLRSLHGLTLAQIETLLTTLARHAIVLQPVPGPAAPDPGDQLLWDLLAARPDLVLVTGDKPLLNAAGMRGRVLSPAAYLGGV